MSPWAERLADDGYITTDEDSLAITPDGLEALRLLSVIAGETVRGHEREVRRVRDTSQRLAKRLGELKQRYGA